MANKVIKRITYKIELSCNILDKGAVVPSGMHYSVTDEKGKTVSIPDLPGVEKMLSIWIGIYYSYPMVKVRDILK